jgi:predicted flap endonuclease-1-like 5' DNA nuclease
MTVDQMLLLGFAVAVFLAAVLLFVVLPARIRRNRARLRDMTADTAGQSAPVPAPVPAPMPAPGPVAGPARDVPALPAAAADGPPDDLRQMKGVGPKLVALLNEMGITRFDQIATLSPEAMAALDARLGTFQGRPERDRWQEQARLLAAGDLKGFERLHGRLGPEA